MDLLLPIVEEVVLVLEVLFEGFGSVGGMVRVVEVQGVEAVVDPFPFILLAEAGRDPGAGVGVRGVGGEGSGEG